jgi:hypothetical protein
MDAKTRAIFRQAMREIDSRVNNHLSFSRPVAQQTSPILRGGPH